MASCTLSRTLVATSVMAKAAVPAKETSGSQEMSTFSASFSAATAAWRRSRATRRDTPSAATDAARRGEVVTTAITDRAAVGAAAIRESADMAGSLVRMFATLGEVMIMGGGATTMKADV